MKTRQEEGRLVSRGLALSIAGIVSGFTVLRYGVLDPTAADVVEDVFWAVFSAAAGVRCLFTAQRASVPRHRTGWALLGIGALLWFGGMLFLFWGRLASPSFSPYPTPANWLFLALAPFFAAGLLFLRSHSMASVDGKRLADLGLISCAALAISAMILLDPLLTTGRSPQGVLFSVLDPAAYVVATVFTLALYQLGDLRGLGPVAPLLVGAVALHMVTDLLFFRLVLAQAGPGLLPLAPGWLVAFGLQYVAAHTYERMEGVPDPTVVRPGQKGLRHGILEAALPAPLIASMAIVGLAFRDQFSGRTAIAVAPLLFLFALFLGLREWWVDRAEERAQRRLEASIELTNQVLAASPAAVFTVDPLGDTGPTFFTGGKGRTFAMESISSPDWTRTVHPDDRSAVQALTKRVLAEGGRSFECRLADDTGAYRWVTIRLAPYSPAEAASPRIVGSIIDVDDTKRLEHRLLRGQRMEALGRLSGGIAHDFNNLLTTILGYAELGSMEKGLSESAREAFDTVKDAAGRARGLTGQLLAFSRRQEMQMEVIDLRERVRDMTNILTRTLGSDVRVDLDLPQQAIPVRADPSQIEQVVLNLVVNAGDAMPEGGTLRIEVEEVLIDGHTAGGEGLPAGRYVRLSVIDTGTGMTADVKERVFEPFFTTKEGGRGTGLGLATLHGVVRQHRGYVEVHSSPGHGTTFHVYLPPALEPVDTPDAPASQVIPPGSETILVVDDEPSIPKLLRAALGPAGYSVLTATSAHEAVALAEDESRQIDLLLTDIVMPDMSGRELAERLGDLRPGLPVVFMSGSLDEQASEDKDVSRPVVAKPLVLGKLASLLRSTLDAGTVEGESTKV